MIGSEEILKVRLANGPQGNRNGEISFIHCAHLSIDVYMLSNPTIYRITIPAFSV